MTAASTKIALWLVLTAQLAALAPRIAHADDDVVVEPSRERRVEAWLRLRSEQGHTLRTATGWIGTGLGGALLIGGGISLGLGLSMPRSPPVTLLSRAGPSSRDLEIGIGTLGIGMGAMLLTLGIATLTHHELGEDTYARWSLARRNGLAEIEIARFEGEMRSQAYEAANIRSIMFWTGVAAMAMGATVLTTGFELGDDDAGRALTAFGSVFAGMGVVLLIRGLVRTDIEDDWSDYERGLAPTQARVHFDAAPMIARDLYGISMTGTF